MISKLYNHTVKALLVYEQFLLTRWKEKIEAWKDHLNANLLCLVNEHRHHNGETSKNSDTQLQINSNMALFSIFDEVKWFKRLDVDIPKAALVCMQKVNEKHRVPPSLSLQRCCTIDITDRRVRTMEGVEVHRLCFSPGANVQALQIIARRSPLTLSSIAISNLSAVLPTIHPSRGQSLPGVRTWSP